MSLKRIITADEHKALAPHFQTEYKAAAEGGNFVLDLTDYEDVEPLKRAKEHEKAEKKEALKKFNDTKALLDAAIEERDGLLKGAIPKADVAKLEKSYQDKLAARETELKGTIATLESSVQTMLVDNVAQSLASEISTAPAVIMPHIKSRLKAEQSEGKYITRVLDAAGAPSAATLADLKKEFSLNKDFAPILVGSKASGGGAGGGKGGGGAPSGKIDFSQPNKNVAAALAAKYNLPAPDAT